LKELLTDNSNKVFAGFGKSDMEFEISFSITPFASLLNDHKSLR